MSILVIGSTGTIGSLVVRGLAEQGAQVRALVRQPGKASLPEGVQAVVEIPAVHQQRRLAARQLLGRDQQVDVAEQPARRRRMTAQRVGGALEQDQRARQLGQRLPQQLDLAPQHLHLAPRQQQRRAQVGLHGRRQRVQPAADLHLLGQPAGQIGTPRLAQQQVPVSQAQAGRDRGLQQHADEQRAAAIVAPGAHGADSSSASKQARASSSRLYSKRWQPQRSTSRPSAWKPARPWTS
ncbi:hypothetical protein FUT87_02355 [Mitsuaria sp. TWR114]|nr:hypothetical protein FUT87_02355 [Mitsuaria sp. TWR114]